MDKEIDQTTTTETDIFNEVPVTPEPETARGEGTKVDGETVAQAVEKPKTYTDADIESAKASVKGGYEGTVKELKTQAKQLREQLRGLTEAATLARVESEGGNVEQARAILQRAATVETREADIAEKEARIAEHLATLNAAGRDKQIGDLIKTHGLDEKTARPELEKAEDPTKMELAALKLALVVAKSSAVPGRQVGAGGQTTAGIGFDKLPLNDQLGLILAGKVK